MKILSDPADPKPDMFGSGRRDRRRRAERFVLRHPDPGKPAHLVVRSAPDADARVIVRAAGRDVGTFELAPTTGWVERSSLVPPESVSAETAFELFNEGPGDFVDYHVWVSQ